jgi:hypothetical protein
MAAAVRVTCSRYGFSLLALFLLLTLIGCNGGSRSSPSLQSPAKTQIDILAVIGFRAALPQGQEPEMVRNPVTGTSFMSWPVSKEVVDWMTDRLFELLSQDKRRHIIPPGKARGVIQSLIDSDVKSSSHPIEIIRDVGNAFSADAVLAGEIYRWHERVGTDFGIDKPASVAFDLSLIRPSDGAIIWRGNYDKTQKSLFENLFDLNTYIKSGGRWLTAKELAEFGLERLISDIPQMATQTKEKD